MGSTTRAGGIYYLVTEINRRAEAEAKYQEQLALYNQYYGGTREEYIKRAMEYARTHLTGPENAFTRQIFLDGRNYVGIDIHEARLVHGAPINTTSGIR